MTLPSTRPTGLKSPSKHFSEDDLELYLLDRLPTESVQLIEEHLLVCETCRLAAIECQEFIECLCAGLTLPEPADDSADSVFRGFFIV